MSPELAAYYAARTARLIEQYPDNTDSTESEFA